MTMEISFLLAATILIANLTKRCRQILSDAVEITIGKDSETAKLTESLPNEFFYFMLEYAFGAVEIEVAEGKTTPEVFRDMNLLSKELTKHKIHFATSLITDKEVMQRIGQEYENRLAMLPTCPWFCQVMPRLKDLKDNAAEILRKTEGNSDSE